MPKTEDSTIDSAGVTIFNGDFSRHSVPRLFYSLMKRNFLGRLSFQGASGKQQNVFFREGQPVYTDLISSKDLLGRILLEEGMITKDAFNASSMELLSTREYLGRILIRMGALRPEQLESALKIQLRRKLINLFTMKRAPFAVIKEDHRFGRQEGDSVSDDALALIHQGVRTHFTSNRVIPELEKLAGQLLQMEILFDRRGERYGLEAEELALIQSIQVKALPLKEIYEMSELPRIEIQQLLYTLLVTEAACIVVQEETEEAEAVNRPTPALSTKEQEVGFDELEATPIYEPAPPPFSPSEHSFNEDAATPDYKPPDPDPPRVPARADTGYSIQRPERAVATAAAPTQLSPQALMEHSQLVRTTLQRMEGQSHYEVLGVGAEGSTIAIMEAYHEMLDLHHPDRCAALGLTHMVSQAKKILKRINEAYDTLSDPQLRVDYDEKLKRGFCNRELQNVVLAEMAFQKGVALLRQKKFDEALIQFNESCSLNDAEGEHVAWAAWTRFCNPKEEKQGLLPEVGALLDRAIELSPLNPICHYYRGQVYLAAKDEVSAQKCFSDTLDLDENHLEALQQLRLMKMRAEKGPPRRGLFSRRRKK